MNFRLWIAFGCLLLVPCLAFGQGTIITGNVVDADDGEALIGANVIIEGLLLGASSDVDGNYSFQVPSAHVGETVELSVKYVGYSPSHCRLRWWRGS